MSHPAHSSLTQLQQHSIIVADTGDLAAIAKHKPTDATTNPTLLLKVAQDSNYQHLLQASIMKVKKSLSHDARLEQCCDHFSVLVGAEILKLIPGKVSTEVQAKYSFDTKLTLKKARALIQLYEDNGIERSRILIKIAGTWQGIEAANILEQEGIHCNITLIFNLMQAIASAQAKAFLISPFVGRISDWHRAHRNFTGKDSTQDPGVQSVQKIYHYLKAYEFSTIIMGASFRHIGQIKALAGCDRLTISPALLTELAADNEPVKRILTPEGLPIQERIDCNCNQFHWTLNQDEMAHYKLAEGIRNFHKDYLTLCSTLEPLLN